MKWIIKISEKNNSWRLESFSNIENLNKNNYINILKECYNVHNKVLEYKGVGL